MKWRKSIPVRQRMRLLGAWATARFEAVALQVMGRPGLAATVCVALFLGGCPDRETTQAVKLICPTIRQYDKALLDQALAEYKALPRGAAIKVLIGDYQVLRDQIRVCRNEPIPTPAKASAT